MKPAAPKGAAKGPASGPTKDDPMRWTRRGIAVFIILVGWIFIAWQNHFHLTPPMVFVCLGYFALVSTVYNLWRTGAAAVSTNEEDDGDDAWGKPVGERGALLREKKTMLKAIKEAEFDHQMGKLSKVDADGMIRVYRARAIEVIKELDRFEAGKVGTVREQIEREVRARLEVEGKSAKNAEEKKTKEATREAKKAEAASAKAAKAEAKADDKTVAKSDEAKADDKADAQSDEAKADDKAAQSKVEAIETKPVTDASAETKPDATSDVKPDAKVDDAMAAKADVKATPDVETMAANSSAVTDNASPSESERKEARQ
jgi:hypothetical protein